MAPPSPLRRENTPISADGLAQYLNKALGANAWLNSGPDQERGGVALGDISAEDTVAGSGNDFDCNNGRSNTDEDHGTDEPSDLSDLDQNPGILLISEPEHEPHGSEYECILFETPLSRDLNGDIQEQERQVRSTFGDRIVKNITLVAQVIQTASGNTLPEFAQSLRNAPGLHMESELLVLDTPEGGIKYMRIYSLGLLGRKGAVYPPTPTKARTVPISPRYSVSFAPANHGNLFGWIRFAGLQVSNLTIQCEGSHLWNKRSWGHLSAYYSLPFIALLASIIVFADLRSLNKISIRGLGIFEPLFKEMWEGIPDRTPLLGHDQLLDQLVQYPFPMFMRDITATYKDEDGALRSMARVENMFGLRTVMQWQTMIMVARHGKHAPVWEFEG